MLPKLAVDPASARFVVIDQARIYFRKYFIVEREPGWILAALTAL